MTTSLMEPGTSQVTAPADREIHIERVFNASRDRVWRAYTEPELLAQWWGRGNKLVIERFELKPGGKWRFVEHSDEEILGFEGEFREVTPKDRIVQTFGWDGMTGHESTDTMTLEDLGDNRTRIFVISTFHSSKERDEILNLGMEQGLNESYAALDRLLAGDAIKS